MLKMVFYFVKLLIILNRVVLIGKRSGLRQRILMMFKEIILNLLILLRGVLVMGDLVLKLWVVLVHWAWLRVIKRIYLHRVGVYVSLVIVIYWAIRMRMLLLLGQMRSWGNIMLIL